MDGGRQVLYELGANCRFVIVGLVWLEFDRSNKSVDGLLDKNLEDMIY